MERETVTKFDLEAAFKALDEIALPDVSGKGRFIPNRINLKERLQAKHAHEVLVEDYFDVSMEEDLNDAQDQREAEVAKAKLARIEKIVDLDAESEEDILPSYVGKVIMQCPQCMTLFYKNEEDIEKSEETPDVVNINEICQHCGNSSGYTLVGKVGGVDDTEMNNFDIADEAVAEEEDELNLDFPEEGTEEVDAEGTGEAGEAMEDEDFDLDLDFEEEPAEEEEETNESLHNSKLLDEIEDKNELKTDIESDRLTLNEEVELGEEPAEEEPTLTEGLELEAPSTALNALATLIAKQIFPDDISKSDKVFIKTYADKNELGSGWHIAIMTDSNDAQTQKDSTEDLLKKAVAALEKSGHDPEIATLKEFEGKYWAVLDNIKQPDTAAVAAEEPVAESMHDSELLDKIEAKNDLKTDIESEHLTLNEGTEIEECGEGTDAETPLQEAASVRIFVDQSGSLAGRKDELMARVAADYANTENQVEFFDDSTYAGPMAAAEAGESVVVYTNDDYKTNCPGLADIATIKNVDVAIEEDLEAEEPLTEDAIDGLFDDLWSDKQPTEEETMAALASFDNGAEDPEEEAFDEFDDAFDTQVTEYLGEVYSNVEKYESTDCTAKDKTLVVEGKITFKSGKTKTTKFVFENIKHINDKIVYRGINESLTGTTKAFRMTCRAEGTKLISESFRYSYKINESLVKGAVK